MKNAKNNGKDETDAPLALSWDTLPDMAKNRWEEAVAFDVTVENQLAKAKADRSVAESERQRIAKEILDATKEVCKEIITGGQKAMNRAKKMEAEAAIAYSSSQDELEQARAIRAVAEGYRDKVMAEVDREAREYIELAKSTTEKECLALRTQAAQESRHILAQVEIMKTAVKEELETQKIYTDAARIKASSDELLSKFRDVTNDRDFANELELDGAPSSDEMSENQLSITRQEPSVEEGVLSEEILTEDVLSKEYGPELDAPELDSPANNAPVVANKKVSNGTKSPRRPGNGK